MRQYFQEQKIMHSSKNKIKKFLDRSKEILLYFSIVVKMTKENSKVFLSIKGQIW